MMIGGLLKPGRRRQQDCFETKFDVTRAAFQGRFFKVLFHGTTRNNNLSMFREKIKLPKQFLMQHCKFGQLTKLQGF